MPSGVPTPTVAVPSVSGERKGVGLKGAGVRVQLWQLQKGFVSGLMWSVAMVMGSAGGHYIGYTHSTLYMCELMCA